MWSKRQDSIQSRTFLYIISVSNSYCTYSIQKRNLVICCNADKKLYNFSINVYSQTSIFIAVFFCICRRLEYFENILNNQANGR